MLAYRTRLQKQPGLKQVVSVVVTAGGTYTSVPSITFTGGGGTGTTATANLSYTYSTTTYYSYLRSGTVSPGPGGRYTTPPTVVISGGGGTGGAATATLKDLGGPILGMTVTAIGSGYTSNVNISFTSNNSWATPGSAIGNMTIRYPLNGYSIINQGSAYTSAPTCGLTLVPQGYIVLTPILTSGKITGFSNFPTAGQYLVTSATISISGGGGTGATATATLAVATGVISSITIVSGGDGYSPAFPPIKTITGGGGGTGFQTAVSTYSTTLSAPVNYLTTTNVGSGYTSDPVVSYIGGGIVIQAPSTTYPRAYYSTTYYSVSSISITNNGVGYSSPPTVTFNTSYGSGASALAILG